MSNNKNSANQPNYGNWNEQFKELNAPMPEQGVFAWRRQQQSLQRSSEMISLERGPSLLQRALAILRSKLSARTVSTGAPEKSRPGNRQTTSASPVAK